MENDQTFKEMAGLTKKSSSYMSLKHMQSLIVLVVGLLAVGCGGSKEKAAPKSQAKVDVMPKVEAKGEVKELTLEEKVVGTYEVSLGEDTMRMVFLVNGIVERYENGKKEEEEGNWKITAQGEIHLNPEGKNFLFRINEDGSITIVARIDADGKREEAPKEDQETFKKIK